MLLRRAGLTASAGLSCYHFLSRLRGLASAEDQILPFPIDFDGRPYRVAY